VKKEEKKKQPKNDKQESNKLVKTKEKKKHPKLKLVGNIFMVLIFVAIVIAAYILINWGVEKLNIPDADFTADKLYSITQPTKDKLGNLEKEVTITILNMSEYTSVIDLAHQYANFNEHIKVEQIDDISTRPDLESEYGLSSDSSVLIFESEGKTKVVETYDLVTYDSTTYATIDKTEESMTNAILDVTVEEKPKIYFLTGHSKYSEMDFLSLMTAISEEANDVETLDLLANTKMPDDCDVLVITTLAEDLTELERDEIIKYIKNGGEILMLQDPGVTVSDDYNLLNYQKVLDEYGITIEDGIIIETDTSRMISGAPNFIINSVTEDSSITKNAGMNISACFINAGLIEFAKPEKMEELGVDVEYLTASSSNAFLRTDLSVTSASKTDEDEELTSSTTGAILTKTLEDGKESKLVVFSSAVFATDTKIQISSGYYLYAVNLYNNEDILLNSISYLTQREDNITIRKSVETVTYTVTEQQHRVILTIIFAVPIAIIILGIVVWQVRRRKK
jgi:ABC-2 type transport system permease protein